MGATGGGRATQAPGTTPTPTMAATLSLAGAPRPVVPGRRPAPRAPRCARLAVRAQGGESAVTRRVLFAGSAATGLLLVSNGAISRH